MAKKRNLQEPEDAGKAAADTRTEAAPPEALEPVKENPTGEPGSLKEKLLKIDGREFTIVPPEPDDPEAAAQLEELEKEFSQALTAKLAITKALSLSDNLAARFSNPAFDAFREQQELLKSMMTGAQTVIEANRALIMATRNAAFDAVQGAQGLATGAIEAMRNSEKWAEFAAFAQDIGEFYHYLEEELKKPEYDGLSLEELLAEMENAPEEQAEESRYRKAIKAAQAARAAQKTIDAQNAGREVRRQLKANAEKQGAIMELHSDALPVFSAPALWDAFTPGRLAKMGKLSPEAIDTETGKVETAPGEILPLNAIDISLKASMLINAIIASSVENYRKQFVADGKITFYVKGVLDRLEVDPRIRDDQQLDFDRKTAGVLYLEKQFEPLLTYIGTIPNGSRYTVLSYDGYDVESDTMTIRSPYLFQLWRITQRQYFTRQDGRALRIAEGKKPLKKDLKPLAINSLFLPAAHKENDTVLEIAIYITNVLLNAGAGAHKTEISFKTLINNCTRLREKLEELDRRPKIEQLADGKRRNNAALYNKELEKIGRAYNLIMNPEKCDALKHFEFKEFVVVGMYGKPEKFKPPTKKTLDAKILIRWRRINPHTEDDDEKKSE